MMAQCESTRPRHDRSNNRRGNGTVRNLVLVASAPSAGRGDRSPGRATIPGPNGLRCTRLAADIVSGSAAWCRRRGRQEPVSSRLDDPIGTGPGRTADLPISLSGILHVLDREESSCDNRQAIAGAIFALRTADVVIAGPLSPDDANAPGLLPHLAELTSGAYRALRPPRELIVHPGFAQVARRFQYIQMSRNEARAWRGRQRYRHPGTATPSAPGRSRRIRHHGLQRPRFALGRRRMVGHRPDRRSRRERGGGGARLLPGVGGGAVAPRGRSGAGAELCPRRRRGGSASGPIDQEPVPVGVTTVRAFIRCRCRW